MMTDVTFISMYNYYLVTSQVYIDTSAMAIFY